MSASFVRQKERWGVLLALAGVIAVGVWFFAGKQAPVPEGMAGVGVGPGGTTLYETGSRPFTLPGLERYRLVSLAPEDLTFSGGRGFVVRDGRGGELAVECSLSYRVVDPERLVTALGEPDGDRVAEVLHRHISTLLNRALAEDVGLFNTTLKRVVIMAEIHDELDKLARKNGVTITNFQLRTL